MADSAVVVDRDVCSMECSELIKGGVAVDADSLKRHLVQLQEDNRILRMEVEQSRVKIESLKTENRDLRSASVTIQQKAEQEEEFISNTLMKKIHALKKEKEALAINLEQEEESITNELQRKLNQLRSEKIELAVARERAQEFQVNKLKRRIEKLEGDVDTKQNTLEQMRREKVELENTLEQEQEALVNRLWKQMERSEAEKRMLTARLDAVPTTLRSVISRGSLSSDVVANVGMIDGEPTSSYWSSQSASLNREQMERQVADLQRELYQSHQQTADRIVHLEHVEHMLVDENARLRKRIQFLELERGRFSANRLRSESESSVEAAAVEHQSSESGHSQWQHAIAGERRYVSAASSTPMIVDPPTACPFPVRCSPTGSLSGLAGLPPPPPPLAVSVPRMSQHDQLHLQLVNTSVSQLSPIRNYASTSQSETNQLSQSLAMMPRVCRECGAILVVYSSTIGFVSGSLNGCPGQSFSSRTSVSSLNG